jgi:L-fuconolactonase
MRIDAHQHFWRYNPTDYAWMSNTMDILRRDHLPHDLEPLLRAAGFDATIAVQARRMERETDWLLELAAAHPFIRGVVGWVDFTSPRLEESLECFAAHPKLKGVREIIHDMPDVDYATSAVHTSAIAKLARHNLTYDLLLKPPHIPAAIRLVDQFPNQPFVVDHIAKPNIAAGEREPWLTQLRELAQRDNVCCKLSGMVTEAAWGQWTPATFEPYLNETLEAFGPSRLMIGSDWPVCTLSGAYAETMNTVIDFANSLAPAERDAILGGTAARFYGIGAIKPAALQS